jgi:hypothetical protein
MNFLYIKIIKKTKKMHFGVTNVIFGYPCDHLQDGKSKNTNIFIMRRGQFTFKNNAVWVEIPVMSIKY